MIIHNPEITGSLIFPRTDGTKVVMQISSQGVLETVEQDATGSATGNIPASNFSGSFTGSFVGDGSQITGVAASSLNIDLFSTGVIAGNDQLLFSDNDDNGTEKRGTFKSGADSIGAVSSSQQVVDFLPAGTVSGSIQVDVEQTTNFTSFSSSIASTFAGLTSEFNEITNNPFSQSASSVTVSKSIIPTSETIDLGTPSNPFRDVYISSASLYIDGTQVLSSNASEITLTTDVNQSLKLVETGADTVQIQTENGDITLTATGTGNIELGAPVQIVAGNQILSSDGNAIAFGEDISVTGNIAVTGTVDGVDVNTFKTSFDTLEGKTLVSGSSQVVLEDADKTGFTGASSITTLGTVTSGDIKSIIRDGVVSGSVQVTISDTTGYTAFSSSLASDIAGKQPVGSYVTTNSVQALNNGTALSLSTNTLTLTKGDGTTDTVDLSSYLDEDSRSIASGVLNGSTGIVTFTRDDASTFTLDLSDLLDDTNLVTSVAGKNGVVTLDTDDVSEGSNLYYTTARVDSHLSGGTGVSYSSGTISIGQSVGTGDTVQFGKVGVGGASDATYELKVSGDIGATGDIVAYISSDERLKDSIELISDPIGKVQSLKGVTWEWNDNASEAAKQSPNVGVIAQDVEKVLPQLVHDRDNGYKGVDYAKLTGLLIEAVKEQQKQIDELKSKLG